MIPGVTEKSRRHQRRPHLGSIMGNEGALLPQKDLGRTRKSGRSQAYCTVQDAGFLPSKSASCELKRPFQIHMKSSQADKRETLLC